MGWSIGWDGRWKRDIGYGVPAYCDHPECSAEIDRGLAYVCGGQPYGGDHGCGLYFCATHLTYVDRDGDEWVQVCERCAKEPPPPPFAAKPDHPDWLQHKQTDPSWAEWRAMQGTPDLGGER